MRTNSQPTSKSSATRHSTAKATRRGFTRGILAALAVAVLPLPGRLTPTASAAPLDMGRTGAHLGAGAAQSPDWQGGGQSIAYRRLFTPASGTLLAASEDSLYRSDDAGETWRGMNLPHGRTVRATAVDPLNHAILYADSDEGLQRSSDEGATWSVIFPFETVPMNRQAVRIAISPADPNIIYLAQTTASSPSPDFWFFRSTDGGASWQQVFEVHNSMCGWGSPILNPHPTDPNRIYRAAGCYAGRDIGDELEVSTDAGASWRTVLKPEFAFPYALVGGAGVELGRFFLATNRDPRSGGSVLYTSGDDGATWTPVLNHQGGGTMNGAQVPSLTLGGLAYDPASPNRVFAGVNVRATTMRTFQSASVVMSTDGGASWSTLGQASLPEITSLALGIDGLNLYASTTSGVWRIALG